MVLNLGGGVEIGRGCRFPPTFPDYRLGVYIHIYIIPHDRGGLGVAKAREALSDPNPHGNDYYTFATITSTGYRSLFIYFFDSKPLLIVKYFCQYKHPPMAGTEDDGRSAGRSFVRSCEVGRYALDRILVDHHTTHVRTLVHTYGEI